MDETGGKVTIEIVFLYERNQLKNSIQMCLSFLLATCEFCFNPKMIPPIISCYEL